MLHKGELPFPPTSPLPGASISPPPFRNDARASWRAWAWNARVDRFLFAPERLARELPPSPTTPAATSPATSSLTHAVPFGGLDAEAVDRRATHQSAPGAASRGLQAGCRGADRAAAGTRQGWADAP